MCFWHVDYCEGAIMWLISLYFLYWLSLYKLGQNTTIPFCRLGFYLVLQTDTTPASYIRPFIIRCIIYQILVCLLMDQILHYFIIYLKFSPVQPNGPRAGIPFLSLLEPFVERLEKLPNHSWTTMSGWKMRIVGSFTPEWIFLFHFLNLQVGLKSSDCNFRLFTFMI